ncbi:MAG: hypothetical protein ACKOCT_00395 [Alphaproteobacteria bacterium]
MSRADQPDDDAVIDDRVVDAQARLLPPLDRLVASVERDAKPAAIDYFRKTREELAASVTPDDLQAVFLRRLAPSGPLALQARVGAESLALLDRVLEVAQEISLEFIEPEPTLH